MNVKFRRRRHAFIQEREVSVQSGPLGERVRVSPPVVANASRSDESEHQLSGFCWCQPTAEDTGDGHIFVHRSVVQ